MVLQHTRSLPRACIEKLVAPVHDQGLHIGNAASQLEGIDSSEGEKGDPDNVGCRISGCPKVEHGVRAVDPAVLHRAA